MGANVVLSGTPDVLELWYVAKMIGESRNLKIIYLFLCISVFLNEIQHVFNRFKYYISLPELSVHGFAVFSIRLSFSFDLKKSFMH